MKQFPARGDKLNKKHIVDDFHDFCLKISTSPPQALVGKTTIQQVICFMKESFVYESLKNNLQKGRRP